MLTREMEALMSHGCSKELATLLQWESLSKEELSVEDLYNVWRNAPKGSSERDGAWWVITEKDKTLEECEWLWRVFSVDSFERAEMLVVIKQKAEAILAE